MGPLIFFDTNILIDSLNGIAAAKDEIKRHAVSAISIISWMEVMAGATHEEEEAFTRLFLDQFRLFPVSPVVVERTVHIRRTTRLKLPDAIILATAQLESCLLVTRNTRDFESLPGIRIPYRL